MPSKKSQYFNFMDLGRGLVYKNCLILRGGKMCRFLSVLKYNKAVPKAFGTALLYFKEIGLILCFIK